MPEYVEPNSEMDAFFAHPRITHRKTRNWPTPGGQRHWYAIDPKLTLEETRNSLERLPIGAYAQSFDWKYDSPSDSGAWVEIQRYPNIWTAKFSNHGWSSFPVPIDFESAARMFWDGLLVDTLYFMGYQRKREPKATTEHMAHSGLSHDLPEPFEKRIKPQIVNHIKRRAAEIDGAKQTPPDPHSC
jgi:hypothetical protein